MRAVPRSRRRLLPSARPAWGSCGIPVRLGPYCFSWSASTASSNVSARITCGEEKGRVCQARGMSLWADTTMKRKNSRGTSSKPARILGPVCSTLPRRPEASHVALMATCFRSNADSFAKARGEPVAPSLDKPRTNAAPMEAPVRRRTGRLSKGRVKRQRTSLASGQRPSERT